MANRINSRSRRPGIMRASYAGIPFAQGSHMMAVPMRLSVLAAIGLGALWPAFQRQQPAPVFRSEVDLVQLDVSVLDKNRQPVHGLKGSDFTVLEDRVPQEIAAFSAITLPDVVIPDTKWMREVTSDVTSNEIDNHRVFIIVMDDAMAPTDRFAFKAAIDSATGI